MAHRHSFRNPSPAFSTEDHTVHQLFQDCPSSSRLQPSRLEDNYDPTFPDHPVMSGYLCTWANFIAFADKPAFKWVDANCRETDSITYRELNSAASAIASHLLHRTPAPFFKGDRVLVMFPSGLDFIKILFASQRAGLIIMPVSPPNPATCGRRDVERLADICREASPRAILAPAEYAASIKRRAVALGTEAVSATSVLTALEWVDAVRESSSSPPLPLQPVYTSCSSDDIFLLQYTSGATGRPKPTLISAGSAAHNARAARRAYDLGPATVIASWLPQFHDCGLMFTMVTVASGATAILSSPTDFASRPCLWLEMVSAFKASCTVVPGFALPLCAQRHEQKPSPQLTLSSLRHLILINEPILSQDVAAFLRAFSPRGLRSSAIAPSYGLAENCTFVSTAWPKPSYPTHQGLLPVATIPSSPDMDIRVVNPATERESEPGSEGEIWVSSPSNASGYLSDPNLSRRAFHARLRFCSSPQLASFSFLRTGDLGRIVGGFLYVTGRLQDVMLVKGRTQHPHFVERSVFQSSSGFRAGCCVAFSVSTSLVLVAEVVHQEHAIVQCLPAMARLAQQALSKNHGIHDCTIALVAPRSIPKTTSGKLRRSLTRHLYLNNRLPLLHCISFYETLTTSRCRL